MINLAQLKADIDAGMIVSRATWLQVLDQALAADPPYRVYEFWSSANPGRKVRMLAEGADIEAWTKRSDFIRVVGAPLPAEPPGRIVTVAELEEGDVIACGSPNAPLSRHALVMSKRTSPNSQYVELTTAIIGKLPAGRDRERIKVCLATDRRIKVTP